MKKYQITLSSDISENSAEAIINLLFHNAEEFSYNKRHDIVSYTSDSDVIIRNVNELIKKTYDPKAKIRRLK